MKVKIIFVLQHMLCRGVERALLGMLKYLPRSKYDITVMFAKAEGDFMEFLPDDIRILELPIPETLKYDLTHDNGIKSKLMRAMRHGNFSEMTGILYRKYVRGDPLGDSILPFSKIKSVKEMYDIAICYHMHCSFLIRYVAEKVVATKKVIWIHNDFFTTGFEPRVYRNELNMYDRFFGVSQQVVDEFVKLMPEMKRKTFLFRNIVSADQVLNCAGEDMPLEYRASRSNSNSIILSVGSLENQKGFDMAIEAADILRRHHIGFEWFILGEGKERDNLQKKINSSNLKGYVHLCGIRKNPYPYYKFCDLYVQPSRHEGYGLAVEEARILECCIIVTDFAGAKEQIKHQLTGSIINFDCEILEKEIRKLLTSSQLRKKYKKNLEKENHSCRCYPQLELLLDLIT